LKKIKSNYLTNLNKSNIKKDFNNSLEETKLKMDNSLNMSYVKNLKEKDNIYHKHSLSTANKYNKTLNYRDRYKKKENKIKDIYNNDYRSLNNSIDNYNSGKKISSLLERKKNKYNNQFLLDDGIKDKVPQNMSMTSKKDKNSISIISNNSKKIKNDFNRKLNENINYEINLSGSKENYEEKNLNKTNNMSEAENSEPEFVTSKKIADLISKTKDILGYNNSKDKNSKKVNF